MCFPMRDRAAEGPIPGPSPLGWTRSVPYGSVSLKHKYAAGEKNKLARMWDVGEGTSETDKGARGGQDRSHNQ